MRTLAFIWDMDGTLADSYSAIVPAAQDCLAAFGIDAEYHALYADLIRSSVADVLERAAAERGLDPAAMKAAFAPLNDSRIHDIPAMPCAGETLAALRQAGHRHFVYTHRGASCATILAQNGLTPYFTEVVTALNGFPRKPAPDGIRYLMEKYGLSPADCFYVGDRRIDMEAAANAGIGGILYLGPGSPGAADGRETYLVRDLREIVALAENLCKTAAI